MLRRAIVAAAVVGLSLPLVTAAQANEHAGLRVGVGITDATWHVGSGGGQYAGERDPAAAELDPHLHSTKQPPTQGVASRLTMRAIVVEDGEGDRVALLKSDLYLAQDHLLRRVGQLLDDAGSTITPDDILHTASHNHSSPYYATPSWGVWLFQDVVDLRAFEHTARAMAAAILEAEGDLRPARMGATTVEHTAYKGNIMGPQRADDGSPAGYPRDFGDHGLVVLRFEEVSTGEPIAAWINYGQHPESLDGYHLITADFLGPLERFVDREVGAPLVFSQGDVGSAEGPYLRDDAEQLTDGTWRAWAHVGHAQTERGARLLADSVIEGWEAIGRGEAQVPLSSDVDVEAMTYWAPGPLSHPYPSVSNCRSETTVEGDLGLPILGLPDCERLGAGVPAPVEWETLKAHGLPVPDHYDAPAFTAVEENLRLNLQAFRLGEVLLASCACEAQVDLILNLESRTNQAQGDLWDGYPWDEHCVRDGAGYRCDGEPVTAAAFERMYAQIHNDAAGWDAPEHVLAANSEPADPYAIWGNFTKEELPPELGYALPVGVGHAGDYNGYTVSYREYMAYDHYRKALTSYGPHTADYMATRLTRMAGALKGGPPLPLDPGVDALDEVRQEATAQALGRAAGVAYDAWRAALPDDVGPAAALEQPGPEVERFSAATFSWRGGSNAVDNPTARVERLDGGAWVPYADQSGEVQTILDLPEGLQGVADTYTGAQAWTWTASFEAFDAFPARLGQVPDGTYRFVVDGAIRQSGRDEPYRLESQPFEVVPWDGITVRDLRVEPGGAVSFAVDPIAYPRTYESPIRMVGDDGGTRICKTCSFRPWAATGEVASAEVQVLGPNGKLRRTVAATPQGDRWVAPTALRPSETAVVARGGVRDTWGEINGDPLAVSSTGTPVTVAAGATGAGPAAPEVAAPESADATERDGVPIAVTAAAASALTLAATAAVLLRRRSRS